MTTVQRLREARGWSRTDLARAAGVSDMAVYRIESGKQYGGTSIRIMCRIADALGAGMDEIIDRETAGLPAGRREERVMGQERHEPYFNAQGLKMAVLADRDGGRADVAFGDGTIVRGASIADFRRGAVLHPGFPPEPPYPPGIRLGDTLVSSEGVLMEIAGYSAERGLAVRFEDGTAVGGVSVSDFRSRNVPHPKGPAAALSGVRIGERAVNRAGRRMEVSDYNSPDDVNALFEDGSVVRTTIGAFRAGETAHPED